MCSCINNIAETWRSTFQLLQIFKELAKTAGFDLAGCIHTLYATTLVVISLVARTVEVTLTVDTSNFGIAIS